MIHHPKYFKKQCTGLFVSLQCVLLMHWMQHISLHRIMFVCVAVRFVAVKSRAAANVDPCALLLRLRAACAASQTSLSCLMLQGEAGGFNKQIVHGDEDNAL